VHGPAEPVRPLLIGDDPRSAERHQMVAEQLAARDIDDPRVLEAMRLVPRHRFVPEDESFAAYADGPLPIASGQTISQPYVVAAMTQLAAITASSRVLEVGTGSGYQTAVLAVLAAEVYSIEIHAELSATATSRLLAVGLDNVNLHVGDGWSGWPEAAPFDAILVTAAPPAVPPALASQLAIGGRLVIPVGIAHQELMLVTRDAPDRFRERTVFPVRFVPMTGTAQRH
jgi:protein-L-isoaspartate(D-aspartate) O-methyltransferase